MFIYSVQIIKTMLFIAFTSWKNHTIKLVRLDLIGPSDTSSLTFLPPPPK